MIFLPIAINITGKKILIIGGGKVGFHKATLLHCYTDSVTVISPAFHEGFELLPFTLIRKEYEPSDLLGAFLVYVCTGDETLNRKVKLEAEALGILTCVCDNPDLCDFISPAIHQDGNISVAVTSNGEDVRRSIAVRDRIKEVLNW